MKEIIRMVHGSHLYGTNVETSDLDYKAVYIPSGKDILLQRVKPSIQYNSSNGRNQPGQEDLESMSTGQFLKLLCQGQTIALDMIFTPEDFWTMKPEPEWYAILNHREKFLSREVKAFVGYCRSQARKYAVKIERFRAIENAYLYFHNALHLQKKDPRTTVGEMENLEEIISSNYATQIEEITLRNRTTIPHLSICDTRVPLTASIREAYNIYSHKFNEYGKRVARSAHISDQDWKSMMHAVRVADEAEEFLTTGKIIFPRPNASFLKAIRSGKIPFEEVSELIEIGLSRVEDALESSPLPEKPDIDLADDLVCTFYKNQIV